MKITIVLLMALGFGGGREVSLDVPKIAMAPAYGRTTIRVRWVIERHPWNEEYLLQWVSDSYSGSTGNSLNGTDEPRVYTRFIDLPSGNYTFRLCVWRDTRHCTTAYLEVR